MLCLIFCCSLPSLLSNLHCIKAPIICNLAYSKYKLNIHALDSAKLSIIFTWCSKFIDLLYIVYAHAVVESDLYSETSAHSGKIKVSPIAASQYSAWSVDPSKSYGFHVNTILSLYTKIFSERQWICRTLHTAGKTIIFRYKKKNYQKKERILILNEQQT